MKFYIVWVVILFILKFFAHLITLTDSDIPVDERRVCAMSLMGDLVMIAVGGYVLAL